MRVYWDGEHWIAPTPPTHPQASEPALPAQATTTTATAVASSAQPRLQLALPDRRPRWIPRERWSLLTGVAVMVLANLAASFVFEMVVVPNIFALLVRMLILAVPMASVRDLDVKGVLAFLIARLVAGIVGWEVMARLADRVVLGYSFDSSLPVASVVNWAGQIVLALLVVAYFDPQLRGALRSGVVRPAGINPAAALLCAALLVSVGWPLYYSTQGSFAFRVIPGYQAPPCGGAGACVGEPDESTTSSSEGPTPNQCAFAITNSLADAFYAIDQAGHNSEAPLGDGFNEPFISAFTASSTSTVINGFTSVQRDRFFAAELRMPGLIRSGQERSLSLANARDLAAELCG